MYLKLNGQARVEINYQAFEQDQIGEGLKGYITNTKMKRADIIALYHQLYHIENAFRMSKTNLKVGTKSGLGSKPIQPSPFARMQY